MRSGVLATGQHLEITTDKGKFAHGQVVDSELVIERGNRTSIFAPPPDTTFNHITLTVMFPVVGCQSTWTSNPMPLVLWNDGPNAIRRNQCRMREVSYALSAARRSGRRRTWPVDRRMATEFISTSAMLHDVLMKTGPREYQYRCRVCRDLQASANGNAIYELLNQTVTKQELSAYEAAMDVVLAAQLPDLLRERSIQAAIDENDEPFYGKSAEGQVIHLSHQSEARHQPLSRIISLRSFHSSADPMNRGSCVRST